MTGRKLIAVLYVAFVSCVTILIPVVPAWAQGAVFLGPGQSLDQAIKKGEYLAHVCDCVACHTKHDGPAFAGGFALPTPFGTLYSPNITPVRRPASGTGPPTISTT